MANRKKKAKKSSGRRRVGSSKGSDGIQMLLSVVAGALVGRLAANKVPAMVPQLSGKIIAMVEAAGGGFLALKGKSPMVKGFGVGVMAAGALSAGQSFGLLAGVGRSDNPIVFRQISGSGYRDALPMITGNNDGYGGDYDEALNGVDNAELSVISGLYDNYS